MTNNLTRARLSELRAIERAATPGPWRSIHKTAFDTPIDAADLSGPEQADRKWCGAPGRYVKADADLIAEARNDLPALLDAIEGAWGRIEQLEKEKQAWSMVAAMQNLGIAAVANDRKYKCQCGDEYTDGEQCPPCFATHAMEIYDQIWQASKGNGDFPANTDWKSIIDGATSERGGLHMTLTPTRLAELRAIDKLIEPGEWVSVGVHGQAGAAVVVERGQRQALLTGADDACDVAAEARNALPALLDAIEGAWDKLDAIRELCEGKSEVYAPHLLTIIDGGRG